MAPMQCRRLGSLVWLFLEMQCVWGAPCKHLLLDSGYEYGPSWPQGVLFGRYIPFRGQQDLNRVLLGTLFVLWKIGSFWRFLLMPEGSVFKAYNTVYFLSKVHSVHGSFHHPTHVVPVLHRVDSDMNLTPFLKCQKIPPFLERVYK